jgi:FkbM family methyltransferase
MTVSDTQYDPSALGRIRDLYKQGGLQEVTRGIHDYLVCDLQAPLHHLAKSSTIEYADTSVTINLASPEDYWRARGTGEHALLDDYTRRIQRDDVVWDIGANIGVYSLLAAKQNADVFAFEPGDTARWRLVDNAQANGLLRRITPLLYALADTSGRHAFTTGGRTGTRHLTSEDSPETRSVFVQRADQLALVPNPDVVKIDVEGSELRVLGGFSSEQLESVRVVYVEVHDGVDQAAVRERLTAHGLDVSEVDTPREHTHLRGER